MDATQRLSDQLKQHPVAIGKVVDIDLKTDKLLKFDFTFANPEITADIIGNTDTFNTYILKKLKESGARYGIGGYMEHRTVYARSAHFDTGGEPRRLHLGVDIWADAGTPVYSPLAGIVHSFQNNDNFGDYGPTIILEHDLNGLKLYSLYGHLSRKSLELLAPGATLAPNQNIGEFGAINENGQWPPHLHFQLMLDMEGNIGDYPGVCRYSEKAKYLQNIPDPELLLQFGK